METNLQAILFDWDGTLLDPVATRETFLLVQWQSFLDELLHIPLREYVRTVLNAYMDCGEAGAAYRKAVGDLNLPPPLAADLHRHALDHEVDCARLYPGTVNLLRHLHKHFRIGILAGGREHSLRRALQRCGIEGYVHQTAVTDAEGTPPCDPQLHQRLLRKLGVRADQAVYVGDDPLFDLRPASLAGLHLIWKRGMDPELPADLSLFGVLDDLRDLPHELRDAAGLAAG